MNITADSSSAFRRAEAARAVVAGVFFATNLAWFLRQRATGENRDVITVSAGAATGCSPLAGLGVVLQLGGFRGHVEVGQQRRAAEGDETRRERRR